MKLCWKDVTGPSSLGTTVDTSALGCHDASAMTAWPPGECSAPTTKSVCPPIPEWTRPLTQVALAWASRSTSRALLTETIRRHWAMRAGSFTVSVRSIRTSGLRSSQAYRSAEPNANDAVTGWPGSSAPAFARPSTPSLNISDHTASPRLRCSPARTASGTAAGLDGLDRRGEHVHLRTERHRAARRDRRLHQHDVRRQGAGQQRGHQRQAAGKVPQPAAHARPD